MSIPARRGVRGILAGASAIGIAVALAACSSGGTPTEPSTAPETTAPVADPHTPELDSVKITGILGPGGTIPIELAAAEFAPNYGLSIEFVPATDSATATSQVVSGEVAASNSSYFLVIDAINQGVPLVVIAEGWASTPGTGSLMALPSSGITELKDLIGKNVNVISPTSSHSIKLRASMLEEGLDPEAVNWVSLPYGEVAGALQDGTIDASSAVGPTLGAVKALGGVEVFDYGQEPYTGMAESGFISSVDFVTQYPNTTAAIQCSIFAAQGALHSDRALYEQYFQSALGAPEAAAKADVMLNFQTTNRIDALNRDVEVYTASGLLSGAFDFTDHTLAAPTNC